MQLHLELPEQIWWQLPEEEIQPLIATIPLGRIGEPERCGKCMPRSFSQSELASYVSGEILAVDGATIC